MKEISERRLIVEKINILTNEIKSLKFDAQFYTPDDYLEATYTYRRIEELKAEIKQLNQEIKKYK